jgi:hypothetical protein
VAPSQNPGTKASMSAEGCGQRLIARECAEVKSKVELSASALGEGVTRENMASARSGLGRRRCSGVPYEPMYKMG